MTSLLRISDIPPDEVHLLPILGLRQQIRVDGNRPSPPIGRTDLGEWEGISRGQPFHSDVPASELWGASEDRFVTEDD
jgi:hypothetical protein